MTKSKVRREELLIALAPLLPGLSCEAATPILQRLSEELKVASSELGSATVVALCDQYLRSEVRATSLNAILVSYLNRFPVELGEICDACLSCLILDTVACGASKGRRTTIQISESVSWEVELGEFYDEWTGCRVWPGAVHISRMLLERRYDVTGTDVIELGSGLGMCGIATMHSGARSTAFTEYKQSLLDVCMSNAERLAPPQSLGTQSSFILDWSDFDAKSHMGFQDFRRRTGGEFVVIGSELVYEEEHGDMLIRVLDQLFREGASRGLIVIMLKPSRPGVSKFLGSLSNLPQSGSFQARIEEEPSDDDNLAACIYLSRTLIPQ